MVQKYIVQESHKKLLVFFAGWACDENPFKDYRPNNMDFMICYDYRNLDFDYTVFEKYDIINIVAWSMGVWAAAYVQIQAPEFQGLSIAYNGSTNPINDVEGLPVKVFEGTLHNLTPASLQKFMRRMCGNSKAYKAFMEHTPRRNFEEIKEELALFKERNCPELGKKYTIGVIGEDDAIFPPENLAVNLKSSQIATFKNSPHYDKKVFDFLLEEMWNMSYDEVFVILNNKEWPNQTIICPNSISTSN